MKKILSALFIFLFSFTLLIGCQDTEDNEKAAAELVSVIDSVKSQSDKLSPDTKEEYISLIKEIEEYIKNINSDSDEFNSQEKINKITNQYNSYIREIENFAEKNDISLIFDTKNITD